MDISLGPTFPDSVQVTPHPPNTSQPKDILWDCYSRIFKRMSFLTARTPATKHLYRTSACATMQSTILIRFFCLSIHLCNTSTVVKQLYTSGEAVTLIEGLRERTEHLDIFLFSAHHSMVFYFRCSVYWLKGRVRC